MTELVERLRSAACGWPPSPHGDYGICDEAADALENALKRISELEDALKPFADCTLDFAWQPDLGGGRIHLKNYGPPPARKEFDAARAALLPNSLDGN
jgi:hypothetical protein